MVAVLGKPNSAENWTEWQFFRSDSKTFENAIHIAKIVLVLPAHGYEAEKSTLVVQRSCILPQKPLDTESPEKVHKNRDSGPFAAFLGHLPYNPSAADFDLRDGMVVDAGFEMEATWELADCNQDVVENGPSCTSEIGEFVFLRIEPPGGFFGDGIIGRKVRQQPPGTDNDLSTADSIIGRRSGDHRNGIEIGCVALQSTRKRTVPPGTEFVS
ncbi:hypothetical protein B0H13DRAFT_1890637 [Mycena leptocephala]|nr:hypothetical protein B0H13DRAFT_1890637 [Mycena leptocephala]